MTKIGKNVIENLTTGMYEDSRVIFREYIQNSADQIDKAVKMGLLNADEAYIDINIDPTKRKIVIWDNATGVSKEKFKEKLGNVADSEKERGVDKGFRGIGRLGGLAYCETLKFTSSYKGEKVKSIMVWDAQKCIEMLIDKNVRCSAEELLNLVISCEEEPCDESEHFFEVEMSGIKKENTELLDKDEIIKYISFNTPVPYSNKFYFSGKIYDYSKSIGTRIDEYKILLNGDQVFKEYCTGLYEMNGSNKKKYDDIFDVHFYNFKNKNGELLAWMWFGISTLDKQIPEKCNEMRGIRLRKENIQIGDSKTLIKFFKEQRGNYYYIGEIHAAHQELIPNGRRDYFNENAYRVDFESKITEYFSNDLHKLYYYANEYKNTLIKKEKYVGKKAEYDGKVKSGFVDKEEQQNKLYELNNAKVESEKAVKNLEKLKEKGTDNVLFGQVSNLLEKKFNKKSEVKSTKQYENQNKKNTLTKENSDTKILFLVDELTHMPKSERKLVSRIYGTIMRVLTPDISENLIRKIHEDLKKNEKKSTTN